MRETIVLGVSAQLTRNYPDLPFDLSSSPDEATLVISRTAAALEDAGYALQLLRDLPEDNSLALAESGQITMPLLAAKGRAAVLLPQQGSTTVMLGGENHVTILSQREGLALNEAAQDCFEVDDVLSRRVQFAFDDDMGYLAAHHSQIGTGLRVSVRLHLPMLTRGKKLPVAARAAQQAGVLLYGIYPAGGKPAGDVLEVCNAMAQGRTEQEIIQLVTDQARKLCEMELELRKKVLAEQRVQVLDRVCRAQALLKSAYLLSMDEFWRLWSDMRLGAALKLLSASLEKIDALPLQAMPAHLRNHAEEALEGQQLDEYRAARVRELLAAKRGR